jgi:hypothetical protein
METKVGWVLSGPMEDASSYVNFLSVKSTHALHVNVDDNSLIEHGLMKFWNLESLGIFNQEMSVDQEFRNEIDFKDGRYLVKLPWRNDGSELQDNFELSKDRLMGLLRKLRHTPELLREFDNIINEQLQNQIVVPVRASEGERRLHYIPHHAVIRMHKVTTKVRIVYDASAKRNNGVSLNSCLHKGPMFDQKIIDILIRFRVHRVVFSADIEKAFLNIGSHKDDRDVLRFLWIDDINSPLPKIVPLRFTRVVFGVTASLFLLNATINHHTRAPTQCLLKD